MILDRSWSVLAVHYLELIKAGLDQQKCSLLCQDKMLEKGCYHSDAINRIRTTVPIDLF